MPAIVFPKEQVPSGGGWPAVVTAVDAKHADCVDCKFMVEGSGGTPYFFPATEVQKWVVGSAVDAKELGREHGHAIAKSPGQRKSGAAATPKRPAATPKRPAVEKEDAAWAPRTGGKRRASVAVAATPTPAAAAEPASPAAQPSGSGKKRAAAAAAEEEALPASAGAQKKRRSPAVAPSVRGASPKRRRYAPPQPDTLGAPPLPARCRAAVAARRAAGARSGARADCLLCPAARSQAGWRPRGRRL